MWADTTDPAGLERNVRRLRACVTAPAGVREEIALPCTFPAHTAVTALGADQRPGSVWLDGGAGGRHHVAWSPLLTVASRDGATCVRTADRELELEGGAFAALAALDAAFAGSGGRLFGYLAYEAGAELESLAPVRARDVDMPDLWLGLHDAWLERRRAGWVLVACGPRWLAPARQRLLDRLGRVGEENGRPAPEPSLAAGGVSSEPDDRGYAEAVARTVARIHAGEIFQTNLCRRFTAAAPSSAWSLYEAMRATGDAAHGAWIVADSGNVLSRSPECFLRVRGDRVESRPIKGTRPRGRTSEEDRRLRHDLETSDKDRAELAMIVDLARNDLGRVCVPGSVSVPEHARLLELPGIWHTVSTVAGRLRPGTTPTDLLRAAFPAGSITGAPKIQAMLVAAEEEPWRRGPAMGSAGWIDPGGDLELSVSIRTAVAAGGRVVYHAGCGIVADSDPDNERQESLVKARPFLVALGQ